MPMTRRGESYLSLSFSTIIIIILLIIYKHSWQTKPSFFPSLSSSNYSPLPDCFLVLFSLIVVRLTNVCGLIGTLVFNIFASHSLQSSSYYKFVSLSPSLSLSLFARVFLSTFSLQFGPRLGEFRKFRNEMTGDEMSREKGGWYCSEYMTW